MEGRGRRSQRLLLLNEPKQAGPAESAGGQGKPSSVMPRADKSSPPGRETPALLAALLPLEKLNTLKKRSVLGAGKLLVLNTKEVSQNKKPIWSPSHRSQPHLHPGPAFRRMRTRPHVCAQTHSGAHSLIRVCVHCFTLPHTSRHIFSHLHTHALPRLCTHPPSHEDTHVHPRIQTCARTSSHKAHVLTHARNIFSHMHASTNILCAHTFIHKHRPSIFTHVRPLVCARTPSHISAPSQTHMWVHIFIPKHVLTCSTQRFTRICASLDTNTHASLHKHMPSHLEAHSPSHTPVFFAAASLRVDSPP